MFRIFREVWACVFEVIRAESADRDTQGQTDRQIAKLRTLYIAADAVSVSEA